MYQAIPVNTLLLAKGPSTRNQTVTQVSVHKLYDFYLFKAMLKSWPLLKLQILTVPKFPKLPVLFSGFAA